MMTNSLTDVVGCFPARDNPRFNRTPKDDSMAEYRVLREIAWRELVPWLILTRVFRVAVRPGALLLALAAPLSRPPARELPQDAQRHPPAALPLE